MTFTLSSIKQTRSDMPPRTVIYGEHKIGKSCLYINKLADVDMKVLEEIVQFGLAHMRKNHQTWDA